MPLLGLKYKKYIHVIIYCECWYGLLLMSVNPYIKMFYNMGYNNYYPYFYCIVNVLF